MRMAVLFFLVIVTGCGASAGVTSSSTGGSERSYTAKGQASYYADSLQGRKTASGEPYDKHKLTAAHRKLAFGTKLRVTNLANGKTVTVRVNDRGPFTEGRILDVSRKAAESLDFVRQGHTDVRIQVID